MQRPDDPEPAPALLRIGAAIADREAVDWEAERAAQAGARPGLEGLRLVDAVASAHEARAAAAETLQDTLSIDTSRGGTGANTSTPVRWGRLRIVERLGQGGFGEVYRAWDPTLQRDVALKLCRADRFRARAEAARFLNEARQLARVRHANVLVVHGADEHEGRIGLWTDLLSGQTLESGLAGRGPWSAQEAALVGIDLCRALAAVHAAGLVHGDVKTSNIMREQGGRIVLMDFGSVSDHATPDAAAGHGATTGTPVFMAPEALSGARARPGADIYSLGVVLFRLVSGRYPVEASSLQELKDKHRSKEWTRLRDLRPDLPTGFVQAIEQALAESPEERFRSAGEMESALARALGMLSSAPAGRVTRVRPWRPWLLLWLAGAVLLLATGVALVFQARHKTGSAEVGTSASPLQNQPTGPSASPGSLSKQPPPAQEQPSHPTAVRDKTPTSIGAAPASVPAAPAPPTATPSEAPKTLTARATLFSAGGKLLMPGGRLKPGEALYGEIEGSAAMYVYVLNEDETGHAFLLFPLPGFETQNPLEPGTTHRLPGQKDGQLINWTVTMAGGRETILFIASRQPLPDLEKELSRVPPAGGEAATGYPPVSPGLLNVLRGIGGTAPAPESRRLPRRILTSLSSDAERDGLPRDLWIYETHLEGESR